MSESRPVSRDKYRAVLRRLIDEQGVNSLLGSVQATAGCYLLLHSSRLNQDVPLLVESFDLGDVLKVIDEEIRK